MMMKMRIYSFRNKIIITLITVISLFSFASFLIYSIYLGKKMYKNSEENVTSFLFFLKDEITNVHDGRLLKSLLKNMEKDRRVLKTYLLDSNGKIKQPADSTSENALMDLKEFTSSGDEISVKTYKAGNKPFSRAFLHVHNSPACYQCHSPAKSTLGYVVFDFSLQDTKEYISFARKSSLIFTVLMVVIILIFVLIMHYRFVKKSLYGFSDTIIRINEGDLGQRVRIPESRELGQLGKSFNQMVEKFQQTQKKLLYYHKKELQDAQKLASIGEMSARLAHDIRNPLTGIVNSIEVIAGEMKESPYRPILDEIHRQANRVNYAISNLLKYSRPIEINLHQGNINEIVKSLVLFLSNQKNNKNIIFKTNFDETSRAVIISVADNGPGITPDKVSEVFKPFFTTKNEGTGLGLAIAKDIIEKHKGEIWFENIPGGAGCIFRISLPLEFQQ